MTRMDRQWQELLAAYVLGDLSDAEKLTLENWLKANPEGQSELASLQETLALSAYGLDEDAKPSESLRWRILQEARQSQTTSLEPVASNAPPKQRNWLSWGASIAAAAAIAVLGIDSIQVHSELAQANTEIDHYRDVATMLQESNTKLVSLKGMDAGKGSSGNIVVTPGTPEVVVTLRNLPVPQTGEVYRLWAVVDGQKVAYGEFMPAKDGSVFAKLPINNHLLAAPLVVTLESATASKSTGPMVMTSRI
jgi:hypothetical protein